MLRRALGITQRDGFTESVTELDSVTELQTQRDGITQNVTELKLFLVKITAIAY